MLDEKSLRYIQEIYNGSLRMSRLIEALLNFSRFSQVEPQREWVDLSLVAHEVAIMLRQNDHERQVEIRIATGIMAFGDNELLRVVLDNLLGNAWKFTGMKENAVIEFGVEDHNGKSVYFVKDNGAGFNNADSVKLFVPFQRLPGAEEYRGFGIGLATVERIIRRHGGWLCPEGELGKGAIFYFTLQA
jgi:light-regulated signal transduction histidine kinase (bacteriophytochrome)